MADPKGLVKPKAVAISPPQSGMQGVRGKTESGLSPTEELRLVAQSFDWLSGERFPTCLSAEEIRALAQAENRKLSAPEVVVVTASEFMNSGDDQPASFREALRKQHRAASACKIILQAELRNQFEDHEKISH